MLQQFELFNGSLQELTPSKQLITTLNAHSYNILKKDTLFREALQGSDVLLPDGISMVLSMRFLKGSKIRKIAGYDLFRYEMERTYNMGGKCFFLGSSEHTLALIKAKAEKEFPALQLYSYSPPYKKEFTDEDNQIMIDEINKVAPDVLFVGMTAPKQEKWAFAHFDQLKAGHICCIGAVFDFYAGTVMRAPKWMVSAGLEWFYRLIREPKRMWKRYLIGNTLFVSQILREKFKDPTKRVRHDVLQSQTLNTKHD